jgi:hypothetical protein
MDATTTTEMGFCGWIVWRLRSGSNLLVFRPHLAENSSYKGGRVKRGGNYETGKAIHDVALGAVGCDHWKLGCWIACPKSFFVMKGSLIKNHLTSIAGATRFPEIVTTQVVTWNGSEE